MNKIDMFLDAIISYLLGLIPFTVTWKRQCVIRSNVLNMDRHRRTLGDKTPIIEIDGANCKSVITWYNENDNISLRFNNWVDITMIEAARDGDDAHEHSLICARADTYKWMRRILYDRDLFTSSKVSCKEKDNVYTYSIVEQ
jgi:hypothetical protein